MAETVSLWIMGGVIGFSWVFFKLREVLWPERVKRRDRIQERWSVLIGSLLLIVFWSFFWEELFAAKPGYQFFLTATLGVLTWSGVVLFQLKQPLPDVEEQPPAIEGEEVAFERELAFAIDGSNIASQQGFDPAICTSIARVLSDEGHTVRIFFDANVGYRMGLKDNISVEELCQRYDFPASSITIVPGGTVADGWILRWAVHNGATIITNDQYRDHREAFPKFDFERKIEKASVMGDDIWLEHRPNPITYTRAIEPEEAPTDQVKPSAP